MAVDMPRVVGFGALDLWRARSWVAFGPGRRWRTAQERFVANCLPWTDMPLYTALGTAVQHHNGHRWHDVPYPIQAATLISFIVR